MDWLFLCFLLFMTSTANAAWLHVCPPSTVAAGMPLAPAIRPDGTPAHIIVNDQPELPGCRSMALPAPLEDVEALYPVPVQTAPGATILLQGRQQDHRFVVSEATFLPTQAAPARPVPMPLHANLLPGMQARPFGVEERVRVHRTEGRLQLACAAGRKPAGVILSAPAWYIPRADVALQLASSGNGSFAWQAVDAAHAATESALSMGRSAASVPTTARLALPRGLARESWQQFVIVCPQQPASLHLDTLELAASADRAEPRSSWVWQSQEWQENGASLLAWARQHGIGELFIAVPVSGGTVRDAAALAAFVQRASDSGVAVWSVEGDPHMVLPAERAATLRRARAYAAYNAGAAAGARLRGVQFDIEPYLLPGYAMASASLDRQYLNLAAALRKATAPMQLEFVVPYWWSGKPGLLRGLASAADSLAVMDYRTDAQEIYRFAVPFLDWGAMHGKRVRIALEAGRVATETQRRYTRAAPGAAGELLLLKMEGMAVLVLLRQARSQPQAEVFRLAASTVFDGTATSFHEDKARLLRLLPQLERDFGTWHSFAGIALHELK